jgi:anti-sigma B factor antagonist
VPDPVVVPAPPELDAATADAFRDHAAGWLAAGAVDLVVDMANVRFVDSAGIGALIGLSKRATKLGGGLQLRDVHERVETTLRISGALRLLGAEAQTDFT